MDNQDFKSKISKCLLCVTSTIAVGYAFCLLHRKQAPVIECEEDLYEPEPEPVSEEVDTEYHYWFGK